MHMDFHIRKKTAAAFFHHSRSETPDAASFERHCHDRYELLYIADGSGRVIVEGREYPMQPGALFLLHPYAYHYVCPDGSCPYERHVLNFTEQMPVDGAARLPILREGSLYFPPEEVSAPVRSVLALVDTLAALSDTAEAEAMQRAIVTQALLLLSGAKPENAASRTDQLVLRVIDYLNAHLSEELSLDETAQRFYISKYYLCRTFRKHTGVSIFAYLTAKRIAAARQLLAAGVPAGEAARQVGFRDYSVFYRAYRKQTGHAPARERT